MNLRERRRLRRLVREKWSAILGRKPTRDELRQAIALWKDIHKP